MANKDWYKDWFNSPYYHLLYNNRDEREANAFLEKLMHHLQPSPASTMLDVACGKGRHSVALNEMGFDVTGIDLSENSITAAKALESNTLQFFQHDMRLPFWINYFDYVFNFFTSFGYFRTRREHDNAIRMMAQSLKKNGVFVIDYLNAGLHAGNMKQTFTKTFGEVTFHITKWSDDTHIFKQIQVTDAQNKSPKHLNTERVAKFSLGDFTEMLADQHLQIQDVYGDYQLQRFDVKKSPRMIIIATKKSY